MEAMAQVHMTESELARDLHGVLARVQEGVGVVVEQDHRPVALRVHCAGASSRFDSEA